MLQDMVIVALMFVLRIGLPLFVVLVIGTLVRRAISREEPLPKTSPAPATQDSKVPVVSRQV